jgi:4-diphosphocytidyl-2-C-methyl-D-erythritol kinase
VKLLSPAKINWYLRVHDKRPDGYHDIETVFHEIALADTLEFDTIRASDCVISGMPFRVPKPVNLIWQAWDLLRQHCPGRVRGVRVRIDKRIRSGGGLGGGSSNAATTLRAVNDLFDLGFGLDELAWLGAQLGSDVPVFIRGGAAVGRGRGELLESVDNAREFHLVLAFPVEHVSTSQAYARLESLPRPAPRATVAQVLAALAGGDPAALAPLIHNDFEYAVADRPWFQNAMTLLTESGCLRAFLTGSGSTVVGLAASAADAAKSARAIQTFIRCEVSSTKLV